MCCSIFLSVSVRLARLEALLPPTPLSHRCFSPVSPPNFAHFPPFFARSLRLGARKPDSAKERRKNGGKRARNGRETVGWVALGYRVERHEHDRGRRGGLLAHAEEQRLRREAGQGGGIGGPGAPYLYPFQGNHMGEAYSAGDGPSSSLFGFFFLC